MPDPESSIGPEPGNNKDNLHSQASEEPAAPEDGDKPSEIAAEEGTETEESVNKKVERLRRAASFAGRVAGRGATRLTSPFIRSVERFTGRQGRSNEVEPTGDASDQEKEEDDREQWPRRALMDTEHGKVLITVTTSLGRHKDKEGVEQRYVYVEELKKAVPESSLTYGVFEPQEPEALSREEAEPITEELGGKFGLPPDLVKKARELHIPLESVKKAVDDQYEDPVETLDAARKNEEMRKIMERLGFNLPPLTHEDIEGVEDLPEHDEFAEQQLAGDVSRSRISEIDQGIRNKPLALWRSLKRPGMRGLRTVAQPLARYLLAWKIYRRMKGDLEEKRKNFDKGEFERLKSIGEPNASEARKLERIQKEWNEINGLRDNGFLGRKKRQIYSKTIKAHDHEVGVAKSKLNPTNNRYYRTDEVPSRRQALAEEIYAIERQGEAFKRGLLNPEDVYVFKESRDKRKEFETHPEAPDIRQRIEGLEDRRAGS